MSIIRKFKMGLIELFRKPTLAEIEALEEESTNIEDELDKVMREANTEKKLDEFMKSL